MTVEQIKTMVPTDSMADDMKKRKANDLIVSSAVGVAPVEEAKEDKPAKKAPAKKTAKKAETQTEAAAE